jgi:hypothetical protein
MEDAIGLSFNSPLAFSSNSNLDLACGDIPRHAGDA